MLAQNSDSFRNDSARLLSRGPWECVPPRGDVHLFWEHRYISLNREPHGDIPERWGVIPRLLLGTARRSL